MKIVRVEADGSADVVGMRCDRCGLDVRANRSLREQFELQEFLIIDFTVGYGGKAFFDGDKCRCDLCQYCVSTLIGRFLRIDERENLVRRSHTNQTAPQENSRSDLASPPLSCVSTVAHNAHSLST